MALAIVFKVFHTNNIVDITTNTKIKIRFKWIRKIDTSTANDQWLFFTIQFKRLFTVLYDFNHFNILRISLFLINVQKTFVNSIKVFKLKNYFTTLFHFIMSYSICNYYFFWFKHPLHTIELKKSNNFDECFLNSH